MYTAGTGWVISVHFGENLGGFEATCAFSKHVYLIGNKPPKPFPWADLWNLENE
jgi:hypothetical protein